MTDFRPITNIQKAELLNEVTLSKLEKGFCPQCDRMAEPNKFYSLVGRHKVISEKEHFKSVGKSGLPEIQTTTKYAYQGGYIPLCESCCRRYKKMEKIATGSAILLGIGIVGTFGSLLVYGISKANVSFGLPFFILFMTMPFVFWFLKSFSLNSERFSSKAVKLNEEFSGSGVPDTSESDLSIVASREAIEKLLN